MRLLIYDAVHTVTAVSEVLVAPTYSLVHE